jgi:hypothetical protein
MATQYVPDCASIVFNQTLFGQNVQNVMHAIKVGGGAFTTTDLDDLALSFASGWALAMLGQQSQDITYGTCVVTDISGPGGAQSIGTALVGQVGGIVSDSLPGNVAYALKLATGHIGRSFRGRIFIAGIPQSVASGNIVNSTWRANTVDAMIQTVNQCTGDGFQLCIVSRQVNGVVLTPPATRVITSVTSVDDVLDSMRSRLTGRGI